MLPARPNNIRFFKYRHQPINDLDYRTQFRFDDTTVQRLSDHFLGPPSNERRGRALTPKQQFEIALKYYSDPGFHWDDDGKDGWGDNNDVPNEDDPLNPPETGATAVRTAGQARREDIAAMISRFPANDQVN